MSSQKLFPCAVCGGFIPTHASSCPHCSAATKPSSASAKATARGVGRSPIVKALGGALGGGAIAFTLMACYGVPPCDEDTGCSGGNDTSDSGDANADGGGRDVNRPDVVVTPQGDSGGPSTDGGGGDANADAGDSG